MYTRTSGTPNAFSQRNNVYIIKLISLRQLTYAYLPKLYLNYNIFGINIKYHGEETHIQKKKP